MRYLQPFVLILSLVATACVADEATVARSATDDTIAAPPDTTLADDDVVTGDDPGDEQPPPPLGFCEYACTAATAEATADCAEFALGAAACGIATGTLCEAVCHSRSAPRSHCSSVHGGKGCMTTQYMWWCDTAVDGNRVRMQYELKSPYAPGVVKSVWAPSHACYTVRFPSTGITKRWRVCAENNGCSAWFSP